MLTVPAAVLDALGGLQESDPPCMWDRLCWEGAPFEHRERHYGHMVDPRGRLLLPASSAALAAVVARAMAGEPDGCIPTLHASWWFTGCGETDGEADLCVGWDGVFWVLPVPDALLDDAAEWDHVDALACVACYLAEERAGVPHGTWTPETT